MKTWDQRTLKIAPVSDRTNLHTLLDGVDRGDAVFSRLPSTRVSAIFKSGSVRPLSAEEKDLEIEEYCSGLYPEGVELPQWVDDVKIALGQRVFCERFFFFQTGLLCSLMHGFVIARFSEVLVDSGYAQSADATYKRFAHTSYAVSSWMRSSLLDRESEARQNVLRVRALHEMARRRSTKKFKDADAGMPISQYDMAIVLLAFTGIALDIVENDMNVSLSATEKDAYLHMWRLIGHLLGIEEKYNIAASLKLTTAMVEEFYQLVPRMSQCPPTSGQLLLHSLLDGMAANSVMPRSYFSTLFFTPRREFLEADWTLLQKSSERDCKRMRDHWHQLAASSITLWFANFFLVIMTNTPVYYPTVWFLVKMIIRAVRNVVMSAASYL